MDKELYVIINSDTDPAIEPIDRSLFNKETVWDVTINAILKLKEEIKKVEDDYGNQLKIGWHLRSDEQMYRIWGKRAYLAEEYYDLWKELVKEGDIIGWHPHLWRFNEEGKNWYQEVQDVEWIGNCLTEGYNELSEIFDIKAVRMGWNFHNNFTMKLISDLGLEIDLSAVAGDKNIADICCNYDWVITPQYPYYPSVKDCRIHRKPSLSILEVPLTTFRFPWCLNVPYYMATKKHVCSPHIGKTPRLMKYAVKQVVKEVHKTGFGIFNSFFHPGDLIKNSRLFSMNYFVENIQNLLSYSRKYDISVRFVNPHELIYKIKGVRNDS